MKRFSTAQLCLAVASAFGAGTWLAFQVAPEPAPTPAASAAPARSGPEQCAGRDREWLARALREAALHADEASTRPSDRDLDEEAEDDHRSRDDGDPIAEALSDRREERSAFSEAVDLLTEDAEARAALMARYAEESDPTLRARMRSLLTFVTTDDVTRMATALTSDSSPELRREGFQLLQQHTSKSARDTLARALEHERDPKALSAAIHASQRGERARGAEVQKTVQRLQSLSAHDDPEVRAESLIALSRWDRSPSVERTLAQGLGDGAYEVKEAAMIAVVESGLRSEPLKGQLLRIATDSGSDPKLRSRAEDTLRSFALSDAELADLGDPSEYARAESPHD